MASEYKTEEEKERDRERARETKRSADERIAAMTKTKEEQDKKLRDARKDKKKAEDEAKSATLAANQKSATFPQVPASPVVIIGTPLAGALVAGADGAVGSKEDVVSWIAAAVGTLGAIGAALTDNPTVALGFATVAAGGFTSTLTRRSRAAGAKMREERMSKRGGPPAAG